jgi:hypothetical protein
VLATVVDGDSVIIDVVGEVEPPPAALLAGPVSEVVGRSVPVEVRWVPRVVLRSSDDDPAGRALALATDAAERWADERSVALVAVELTDGAVAIDLAGSAAPEVLSLAVAVRGAWEEGGIAPADRPPLEVRFTPRERLVRIGG